MLTNAEVWNIVNKPYDRSFVSPLWDGVEPKMYATLLPEIPCDFLQHPVIEWTMAAKGAPWASYTCGMLENIYGDELYGMISDSAVGRPHISSLKYTASDSTIMQALHWHELKEHAKINGCDRVLEWGGGYGNAARYALQNGKAHTWTIIDLPIMIYLQYHYLKHFTDVNLITDTNTEAIENGVNLVALSHIDSYTGDECPQMFWSTFAINESADYAGQYLNTKDWYGCTETLIAWTGVSDSITQASKRFTPHIEAEVPYQPSHRYVIK